MTHVRLFLLILGSVFLLANGCKKKDSIILEHTNCLYNYTELLINKDSVLANSGPFGFQDFMIERYQYYSPMFNPHNQNEIAYMCWDTQVELGTNPFQIRKFNFCTGLDEKICNEGTFALQWGNKDWIAFSGMGSQITIVKSNGDSLTYVTNGGIYTGVNWDDTGNILFYRNSQGGQAMSYDIRTGLSDTVPAPLSSMYIIEQVNEDVLLCITCSPPMTLYCGLFYYDIPTDVFTKIEYSGAWSTGSHYIKAQNAVLWSERKVIGILDLETVERNILTIGADNRLYFSSDLSTDEKTILLQRESKTRHGGAKLDIENSICLMNIDGTDERKVIFPE